MRKTWILIGRMLHLICWPLIYVVMKSSVRVRVILQNPEGKILAIKPWISPDEWTLPGGGIRRGEDPAEAAARELKEETKIVVTPNQLKYFYDQPQTIKAQWINYKFITFYARLKNSQTPKARKTEIVDLRWFEPKELLDQPTSTLAKKVVTDWIRLN